MAERDPRVDDEFRKRCYGHTSTYRVDAVTKRGGVWMVRDGTARMYKGPMDFSKWAATATVVKKSEDSIV